MAREGWMKETARMRRNQLKREKDLTAGEQKRVDRALKSDEKQAKRRYDLDR